MILALTYIVSEYFMNQVTRLLQTYTTFLVYEATLLDLA